MCPSTENWPKKVWYTHTHNRLLLSHKKKNEMLPFAATWVDLENIILSEFRKRQILYGRFYVESKI